MQKADSKNLKDIDQEKVISGISTIWKNRTVLYYSLIVFGFFGIGIALLSPKEYVSWTTMVPQTTNPSSKLGGISSLAAMAGFNLDMAAGDDLSPSVYPQIVGSVLFQKELIYSEFNVNEASQPVTLYNYYIDIRQRGFLRKTVALIKNLPSWLSSEGKTLRTNIESPIQLTLNEDKVRKLIEKQVTMNVDSKNGYVTLYSAFPEAILSAEVAEKAKELLQKYITEFKIKKATDQLTFIEDRYKEKKAEFLKAQQNLAWFRDQNKNISSAIAATEEERLRSEYTIAQSVYNELAKQLEQAKIQVKQDTPVFSIIQPARVPLEKNKPKKLLIITVWLFLGGIIGVGIILGRDFIGQIKRRP